MSTLTTCSICQKTFEEPKVLPCIHTFCLQCLDSYCESKKQEQEVTCPLCRKAFLIPPGGVQDLPYNIFIKQLLEVNKSYCISQAQKSVDHLPCELCSDFDAEIASTTYCVDCDQHICDRCAVIHKKASSCKSHQVVPHADLSSSQKRVKLEVNYCAEHPCEENRLYCYDCKTMMCHKCLSKHNQHSCSDVDEAVEIVRDQLSGDVNILSTCIDKQQSTVGQLEEYTRIFLANISFTESEMQKYDELISLLQSHKSQLMEQTDQFKDQILKKVETKKDEVDCHCAIAKRLRRSCREMMNKGTASDIFRTAHDLHARAEELVKTEFDLSEFVVSDTTFTPCLSTTDSVKNLFGELILGGNYTKEFSLTTFLTKPKVLHVVPIVTPPFTKPNDFYPIMGITVVCNEVFVVRGLPIVYVYQTDDFSLLHTLEITGAKQLHGIAGCTKYNHLYLNDSEHKIVYRYDIKSSVLINWSAGPQCTGVSVTKYDKLLTTLPRHRCLQIHLAKDGPIHEIDLDGSLGLPFHSVQQSAYTDNIVICKIGANHQVCIVDINGQVVHSYGGSPGSGVGQLHNPAEVVVDAHDNVLVVDFNNKRVQLLSPTLTYLGNIVIPGHTLNEPSAVHFDKINNRLYIGESKGGRMFVLSTE